MPDETTPLTKISVVMLEVEDSFLLLKYGPEGSLGSNIGKWTLPGGLILPGESDKEAALRWLAREAGIRLDMDDIVRLKMFDDDVFQVHLFHAKLGVRRYGRNSTAEKILESVKGFITHPVQGEKFDDAVFLPRGKLKQDPSIDRRLERMKDGLGMLMRGGEMPNPLAAYPLVSVTAHAIEKHLPYPPRCEPEQKSTAKLTNAA